jgi:hypothetical protein
MEPIVSVKEARKILGVEAEKLTDDQIISIITDLDFIAHLYFKGLREGTIKIPLKRKSKK